MNNVFLLKIKKKKRHYMSKLYNDNDYPVIFSSGSDFGPTKLFFKVDKDLHMKQVNDQNTVKKNKITDNFLIAKSFNIGYYLITPLLAGVFFGYWLDMFFKTKPLFILLLFMLGIAGSFYNLWKIVKDSSMS